MAVNILMKIKIVNQVEFIIDKYDLYHNIHKLFHPNLAS